MADALIARYRRWYVYERESHAKLLASLDSVPEEGRRTPEYQRALGIAGHIDFARRIWLDRLAGASPRSGVLFPNDVTLEELAASYRETESRWEAYLESLDDATIEHVLEYHNLNGIRCRNKVEDVLAQLFGHSWYHRGQIAMLVRTAGGEPAATDLIHWRREAIPEG